MTQPQLDITDSAAARIQALMQEEGTANAAFRVTVEGGGCSGFQYKFAVETQPAGEHDITFTKGDAKVVVDDISLGLLGGSQIDFVESLAGSAFEIKNPNSTSSCGCGNSFSVV